MGDNPLQQMMDHIEKNEGREYTPYKINGQLTTGVGFKVTDADAFAGLPFKITDSKTGQGRYATDAEKRQEFERLKSMSNDQLRGDKNAFTLGKEDIDTKLGPVDEDGQYGPQTDFALKHATARLGPDKVGEAFALGRFNTFARNAQKNSNPEGLEDRTHSIFAPLFRDPADGKASKVEGGVLQETLNGFGQDLKVDNWIGPKTTEAFNTVLRENDADELTRAFGRQLGML